MSLQIVKKDIENENIPPVYLWYGEDRYTLTEALQALKKIFLREDPSGSEIEVFFDKETSLEYIVEAANSSSFFSRRLVIVDGPGFAEGVNDNSLLDYCRNPNPAACLVLISEKINRGRKIFKEILKAGKVLEFTYPKGQNEWQVWDQNAAKLRGKNINPATASFLVEWAGHNTGILSQEIDKASSYAGENPSISKDDIRKVCIPLVETTVFAMVDAIAAGNTADALQKLREVLSQEHYLKVYTMIVRQIRLLLAGTLVRKKGEPVERFMEITGIRSSFEGNKIFRQSSGFSSKKLAVAMEDCLQTELALKSSGGNPDLLLELMVIRFCNVKK